MIRLMLFARGCRLACVLALLLVLGRAQTIYVSNLDRIVGYNSVTGALVAGSLTAPGQLGIFEMAIDPGGRIYTSLFSAGNVGVFNASNGATINAGLLSAGVFDPGGIAVDSVTNRLYVGSLSRGTIGVFNATTGAAINASFVPSVASPQDMVLDASGRLYVVNNSSRVSVYDAGTGATLSLNFIPGLSNPLGVTLDGNGRLYVTSYGSGTVGVYDALTGTAINASLISGLNGPRDIAIDGSGHLFVSSYNGSYYIVSRYDAFTGALLTSELAISGFAITSLAFVPVPEPSTVALLLLGGAGLGVEACRRRRLVRACG